MSDPIIPGIEILSRVGEGGMGVVYAARQPDLNRRVAVKVLREALAGDPAFVLRFLQEARAAAKISDPNVVSIYDVGQGSDSSCYIVMEYIEGEPLDRVLKRGRPPLETSLSYMTQALKAVSGIHQQGVLHRDIKPSNLMIQPDGRVKLVDFGLARPAEEESTATRGRPIGTPKYVSPEQARGEAVDERSDLYSLGVLFYEMLSGRHPANARTPNEFLLWHASRETRAAPLRRVAPDVPARVAATVQRLIEKDPDRRLPSAEAALRSLQHGPPSRISKGGMIASLVSLALLGLVVLPYVLRRGKSEASSGPGAETRSEPREVPRESATEAAARRLRLHWDGASFLTPEEIRSALDTVTAQPEDPASRGAFQVLADRAARVEAEAEAALGQSELDLSEQKAHLLMRDFPVDPWPDRAQKILERVRAEREAKADPGPEANPDAVFGLSKTLSLPFVPADATCSSDSAGLFLLDRASGSLVLFSLPDRKEIRRLSLEPDPVRLASRDGTIYVACRSGSVVAVDEASMKPRWTLRIPEGRPSAIAAPERDGGRVYAADGERLYVITDRIVETVSLVRGIGRNASDQPARLCVHPDGRLLFVTCAEGCLRLDRGADGTLAVRERSISTAPIAFDPHGQYLLSPDGLLDPARRVKYAALDGSAWFGFHPDLPWAVAISSDGRPWLFDLHRCAAVPMEDSGMRLSARGSSSLPLTVLITPDAKRVVVLARGSDRVAQNVEPPKTVWVLPLRPENAGGRGRLACGTLFPEYADVGYPTAVPIGVEASVAVEKGPAGMSFDASRRALTWTPEITQLGEHEVRLALSSGKLKTEVRFKIDARLRSVDVRSSPGARLSRDGDFVCARVDSRDVVAYDLASGTARWTQGPDRVQDVIDEGDDLYLQVPGEILFAPMKSLGKLKSAAKLDLESVALDGLRTGGGSLFLFEKKDDEYRCLRIVPGEPARVVLREKEYFPLWTVDPAGALLVGFRSGNLMGIRLGSGERAWSRKWNFRGSTDALRWMPDGKRICVGGEIVSAEDGTSLKTFEGAVVAPDPGGELLAAATSSEVTVVRDGTYEVLGRFSLTGVTGAVPVRKHGLIVVLGTPSVRLLPWRFP